MKIPVLELPKTNVRALPVSYDNTRQESGLLDVAKGVGQLEQGISAMGEAMDRANAVHVASGVTSWKELQNKRTAEFNVLEGKAAVEASGKLLEAAEKDRVRIRDGLTNERQRTLFEQKSREAYVSLASGVEARTEQQRRVAEEQESKRAELVAEQWLGQNPRANDEDFGNEVGYAQSLMQALESDPEVGRAKGNAYYAKMTAKRMEGLIDAKAWDEAQALIERDADVVGVSVAETLRKRLLDRRGNATAEVLAQRSLLAGRDPLTGSVDPAKARTALGEQYPQRETDETQAALFRKAADALEHHLTVEKKNSDVEVAKHLDIARRYYSDNGTLVGVPDFARDYVRDHDMKAWTDLEDHVHRQKTAEATAKRQLLAEGRAAQREYDRQVARQEKAQAKMQDENLKRITDHIRNNAALYKAMDPVVFSGKVYKALSRTGLDAAVQELKRVQTADLASHEVFKAWVKTEIVKVPEWSGDDKASKQRAEDFTNSMNVIWFDFPAKNGRPPTQADFEAMKEAATKEVAASSSVGDFVRKAVGLPPTSRPREKVIVPAGEAQAPVVKKRAAPGPPPAPAKELIGYDKSKDGKLRRPVYSDGTKGPSEAVP